MRLLVVLVLLLGACNGNPQNEADLRTEYDSVVKKQVSLQEGIQMGQKLVDRYKKDKSDQESIGLYDNRGYNDSQIVLYSRGVDSYRIVNEKLEARRKELAKQLFK